MTITHLLQSINEMLAQAPNVFIIHTATCRLFVMRGATWLEPPFVPNEERSGPTARRDIVRAMRYRSLLSDRTRRR